MYEAWFSGMLSGLLLRLDTFDDDSTALARWGRERLDARSIVCNESFAGGFVEEASEGFGAFFGMGAGGSGNSHRRRPRRGGGGRRCAGRSGAGGRRAAARAGLGRPWLSACAVTAPRQDEGADSAKRDDSGSHVTGQNSPHLDPYGADVSQRPEIESTDSRLLGHLAIHRQRRHQVQRAKGPGGHGGGDAAIHPEEGGDAGGPGANRARPLLHAPVGVPTRESGAVAAGGPPVCANRAVSMADEALAEHAGPEPRPA